MDKPNILLIVLDSVRQDALPCYGNEKNTAPNIDKLAEEGVKFENHFSAAGWTLWSHPAIFSGNLPTETNIQKGTFEPEQTVAEGMKTRGYDTFGIRTVSHISKEKGFDRGFNRYIDAHHDYSRKSLNPYLAIDTVVDRIWGRRHRTFFSYKLLKKQLKESKTPYFGFINFTTAHRPYIPPFLLKNKFKDGLDTDKDKITELMNMTGSEIEEKYTAGDFEMSDNDWQTMKNWFYADLYRADFYIGRLIKHLKRKDEYKDTVLIVTSDHGDEFGEHNLFTHNYLYDTCLKVPLVIAGGPVEEAEINGMTSHQDMKEIIEFISQRNCSFSKFERDFIYAEGGGDKSEADRTILRRVRSPSKTVRSEKYKLIARKYAQDELYNIEEDPEEQNNVIEGKKQKAEELRKKLPEFGQDSTKEDEADDEKIKKRLEHLGYK